MKTIFISHSSKDKILARSIKNELEEFGLKLWIDEIEINIGDSLVQKISDGIDNCDFLLAIISINSINSNWVNKELLWAVNKEIQNPNFKVLPIVIDDCEVPNFLNDKLYFKLSHQQDMQPAIKKIIKSIISSPITIQEKNDNPNKSFSQFDIVKLDRKNAAISFILTFLGVILILMSIKLNLPKSLKHVGFFMTLWGLINVFIYQRFENAHRNDRALLRKIDDIGGYILPFDLKWRLQFKASETNKYYRITLLLETVSVLFLLSFLYYLLIFLFDLLHYSS